MISSVDVTQDITDTKITTNISFFKVNKRNSRKRCEICSGGFIFKFKCISNVFAIADLEQVNICWKSLSGYLKNKDLKRF